MMQVRCRSDGPQCCSKVVKAVVEHGMLEQVSRIPAGHIEADV